MGRDPKDWGPNTRGVRAGLLRSPHKETSEALYLTSGFVYDSAEEADARFEGTAPGYLYGRYANPTNTMLIERLCALEGAEDGRLAASGMAAVTAAMLAPLKAGDHVVAGEALFQRIDRLFQQPDGGSRDLAAVYLAVLGLGFEGKFRAHDSRGEVTEYRLRLHRLQGLWVGLQG